MAVRRGLLVLKLRVFSFGITVLISGIVLGACNNGPTNTPWQQPTLTIDVSPSSTSMVSKSTSTPFQNVTPQPEGKPTDENLDFDGFGYYEDYESYENDILAYLNSGHSPDLLETSLRSVEVPEDVTDDKERLTDPVVRLEDVTEDGKDEVIVLLRWQSDVLHQDDDRVLLILLRENGKYRILDQLHARRLVKRPYDMELEMVEDINLDGRNEIVLMIPDFQGPGGVNFLFVTYILAWTGTDFEHLIQVPEIPFSNPIPMEPDQSIADLLLRIMMATANFKL
jgi:hypothetical protein